jgi:hypothetical protein
MLLQRMSCVSYDRYFYNTLYRKGRETGYTTNQEITRFWGLNGSSRVGISEDSMNSQDAVRTESNAAKAVVMGMVMTEGM